MQPLSLSMPLSACTTVCVSDRLSLNLSLSFSVLLSHPCREIARQTGISVSKHLFTQYMLLHNRDG